MSRSDQEWVRALKQNDAQAEQELWEFLFTVASYRKYQTDTTVADIARDAAVIAYGRIKKRAIYQFRFECPFPGYCLRIFANEFNRLIIRAKEKSIPYPDEELAGEDADVYLRAPLEAIQQRIQKCLDRLVQLEKSIIESYYFKHKNPEDAAAQLAITRNHYGVLAHRARQKLKRCLESMGFDTANAVLSL